MRLHLYQLHAQPGRLAARPRSSWPQSTGSLYAGKDGKTGETLMKTVLAPMFAHRNLKVMSWVGHNIFGNRDGLVLDDPSNKSSKVETKDRVVTQILGYKPSTLVTIEYLPDMGDWKTAWDHIHFQGFLGTKMTLQFTWQGCDSLLAAPLAIDLARLADLEKRRGGRGLMKHLACFFKSPEGVEENDFFKQFDLLVEHLKPTRPGRRRRRPSTRERRPAARRIEPGRQGRSARRLSARSSTGVVHASRLTLLLILACFERACFWSVTRRRFSRIASSAIATPATITTRSTSAFRRSGTRGDGRSGSPRRTRGCRSWAIRPRRSSIRESWSSPSCRMPGQRASTSSLIRRWRF